MSAEKFECAVCHRERESKTAHGEKKYTPIKRGRLVCWECMDARIERDLARHGGATLRVIATLGGPDNRTQLFFAVSPSWKVKIPVILEPGEGMYTIARGRARIQVGKHFYSGRMYNSGMVRFQRELPPPKAETKAKATTGNRARGPQATGRQLTQRTNRTPRRSAAASA